MNTPTTQPNRLDDWLEIIRGQNLPIFDSTVQKIVAVSRDESAPMSELAGVILQDPALTARVLKLANSIVYNPTSAGISTISRAVIVLGFNAVRNICLTLALVDALLKGAARERLGRELGRAMHAAFQARAMAMARGDKSPEEVFIATLLYRIGELAFWSIGSETGDRLERLASQPGCSPEQAQDQVLGFRLSQLSKQLIREWRLTELLQAAINHPANKDVRIQTLMLGHQIARCAEDKGWQSDDMERLMRKAAELTRLPPDDARTLLLDEARAAVTMACDYGAPFAAKHIPRPDRLADDGEADAKADELPAAAPAPYPAPDRTMQVKILRELAGALDEERCGFNLIVELVLEGIHRGVGTDRVLFALTTPDKRCVKAKYALGENPEAVTQGFQFSRDANHPDILFQTLDRKLPRLVTPRDLDSLRDSIPATLTGLMGAVPFMVAPIIVNHQSIGLFYADRGPSRRQMDAACFDDFKHFVNQANMGLSLAASRSRHGG